MKKFKECRVSSVIGVPDGVTTLIPKTRINISKTAKYKITWGATVIIDETAAPSSIAFSIPLILNGDTSASLGGYVSAAGLGVPLASSTTNTWRNRQQNSIITTLQEGDYLDLYCNINNVGGTITTRDADGAVIIVEEV